jgi:hypothetical protein
MPAKLAGKIYPNYENSTKITTSPNMQKQEEEREIRLGMALNVVS